MKLKNIQFGIIAIILIGFVIYIATFARPGQIYGGAGVSVSATYNRVGSQLNYVIHGGYCDGCDGYYTLTEDCSKINVFGFVQDPYTAIETTIFNETFEGDFTYNSPTIPGWCDSVGACTSETISWKCVEEETILLSPPPEEELGCMNGQELKQLCSDNETEISVSICEDGVYVPVETVCPAPEGARPDPTLMIIILAGVAMTLFIFVIFIIRKVQ